jgi:hypothetical protein
VLEQMREHVRLLALLHIAYARSSLPASNRPKVTTRVSRFLQPKFGKDRKSKRRLPWDESSMLHYWMEGCFANSNTRFRKFFRLTRARFDEIYEAAAVSGLFVLNPAEPLYAKACPPPPSAESPVWGLIHTRKLRSKVNPGSPLGHWWVPDFLRASVGPRRKFGNGGSR